MASPDLSQVVRILIKQHRERLKQEQELLTIIESQLAAAPATKFVPTPTQRDIMAVLKDRPGMTADAIAAAINSSKRQVQRSMAELLDEGIAGHSRRTGYYLLTNPPTEVLEAQ